ncbi:response regulator [Leptospira fluminis]|uniref:histidine kinase n=1 Tax=Leptospira fluminis TaxID=2484979 RepID=A0A4R9GRS7_9LEPT|nr:histidine kinase dimerization/phosphoacceptor domain -containing protein [Leptospira fluminis]TGK19317.1 response regulator [Leptospira fluminis]
MDPNHKVDILVVDDNPENLRILEHIFANLEVRIVKAQSGVEALKALLEPEDFALIFMDVRMPGLDGFEVASLIRQREKCAHIPIIFLTAYGGSETGMFKGYSLGAVDFLVKPIAPEILRSKVSVFVELYKKNKMLAYQEEMLRQSRDQLELRVKERTRELHRVNEELVKEIAERTRAETALKVSLREKEILLREIHHRVKNNLQVVSSILSLQGNYITDRKSYEIFEDSQFRIRSIALIHELLYQNEDLARMNFRQYLNNLVSNLLRTYRIDSRISFEIDADQVYLSLDSAIHCGLIVTELVTNSLKYGFKEQDFGKVSIQMKALENESYVMTVADDGVGFPQDVDFKKTDSLGLQLVNALAEQIDGTLTLDREGGTKFRLEFRDKGQTVE